MASQLQLPDTPSRPAPTATGDRWPHHGPIRWLLRLICALPWIGFALWAHNRGYLSPELLGLETRADQVIGGGGVLAGLRYGYPPIPMILALLPGGVLVLGIISAFAMGSLVFAMIERLRERGVTATVMPFLLATIVLAPAVWYLGSQNLSQTLTLAFLGLALEGFFRFAIIGETEGGFVAGLLLGVAILCGPEALFYVVAMCAAAPLVAYSRYMQERGAATATFVVLSFPCLAVIVGWAFLEWRFAGTSFGTIGEYQPQAVWDSAVQAGVDVLHAPLYLVVGAVFAIRRPLAMVAYLIPVLGLIVTRSVGFPFPPAAGYLLLTLVALAVTPRRPRRWTSVALVAGAVAQVVFGFVWAGIGSGFWSGIGSGFTGWWGTLM